MAELVFRSARKITHADWLLNGPTFHDIEPVGPVHVLLRTGKFWRENLWADFNEVEVELSI